MCEKISLLGATPGCPLHGNWNVDSIKWCHHPGAGNPAGSWKICSQQRLFSFILGPMACGFPFWNGARWKPPGFAWYLLILPPLYQSVIRPSSMLLCLAPHSTHGDLFLRHRQMGSSLESCSKLEEGDCSFQERESFGSTGICSCFRAAITQDTIPSSQIFYHDVNKRLRMCRQLVSLEHNSILGKQRVSTRPGAKF